jgi:hypothetical protein
MYVHFIKRVTGIGAQGDNVAEVEIGSLKKTAPATEIQPGNPPAG